jgi:hypothetical protein
MMSSRPFTWPACTHAPIAPANWLHRGPWSSKTMKPRQELIVVLLRALTG